MATSARSPSLRARAARAGWGPFGVALVAALAGALGAYALQYEPAHAAPSRLPVSAQPLVAEPGTTVPSWLHLPNGDEPVLTLAELLELKASLTNAPDASGEFTRLAEQMLFFDAAQRFQQLRTQGGDAKELLAVAELIDGTLDTRLRRGEIALADAHALKHLVLQVRQPDVALRQVEFVRWAESNTTPP